jgi:Domain of unknown function (DUF4168)
MTTSHTHTNFSRLSRPLLLGIISLLGIFGGIVPDLTQPPNLFLSGAARADEFKPSELRNYHEAAKQMESIRQSALPQVIRANSGSALPNLVCNQPVTMDGLTSEAKSLFIKYCNQCETIAADKGLSIERFNQIHQAVRSNPRLLDNN